MRAVIQRVNSATLYVDDKKITDIKKGFLVAVGITKDDDEHAVSRLVYRLTTLRLFQDESGKLNKNIFDINGEILVVSNFTLCSTNKGGTRPDFSDSADKEKALFLFNKIIKELKTAGINAKQGVFGAHMHIDTCLDGPVTLRLDTI